MRAGGGGILLVGLEVDIQQRKRVVAQIAASVAQRLELGQAIAGGGALGDEAAGQAGERALQLGIGQGRARIAFEVGRLDVHGVPSLGNENAGGRQPPASGRYDNRRHRA